MKKIVCFEKQESPYMPGKWVIVPKHDKFYLETNAGSFNVICARLFGISYADYLRMCRDCFGAIICGKGHLYPISYFNRSKELDILVESLNARANVVLWNRKYPDYEEHKQYVKEKSPLYYNEVIK